MLFWDWYIGVFSQSASDPLYTAGLPGLPEKEENYHCQGGLAFQIKVYSNLVGDICVYVETLLFLRFCNSSSHSKK